MQILKLPSQTPGGFIEGRIIEALKQSPSKEVRVEILPGKAQEKAFRYANDSLERLKAFSEMIDGSMGVYVKVTVVKVK